MESREEAVAYFEARGFYAAKRDWVMGNTILVAKSRSVEQQGIHCLHRAFYLYPVEKPPHGWGLYDMNDGEMTEGYADLGAAVHAVEEVLNSPPKLPPKPRPAKTLDTTTANLLPQPDMTSAAGTARQILWALHAVLRWDAPHPRAGTYVFRTKDDMVSIWRAHGGGDSGMPDVDFAKDMVVAVFVDEGSYTEAPSIRRVEAKEESLEIHIGKSIRPWQMINPACVIRLPRVEKPARWVHM